MEETFLPSNKDITRRESLEAWVRLWVVNITEIFFCVLISVRIRSIAIWFSTSTFEVRSSKNMTLGEQVNALAMATR